ncbi:MAG: hypothetical protein NT009_10240 [Proteobacteria bacterium]|nr:hypothetical protein [Pseudomonadota bacterium]
MNGKDHSGEEGGQESKSSIFSFFLKKQIDQKKEERYVGNVGNQVEDVITEGIQAPQPIIEGEAEIQKRPGNIKKENPAQVGNIPDRIIIYYCEVIVINKRTMQRIGIAQKRQDGKKYEYGNDPDEFHS